MEAILKNNELIVPAKEGKCWCRVIHSAKQSDFADKYRTRTKAGTLCDFYELGPEPLVVQVSNGTDRCYFKASGDTLTEVKSYEISTLFPAPKTIKVTLEVELGNEEFITKLLSMINSHQ